MLGSISGMPISAVQRTESSLMPVPIHTRGAGWKLRGWMPTASRSRGPSLTHGYIGNEQATNRSIRDGWLDTGDVARLDEDGYLYIEGRADDMIQTGGENVHPQAVEEVLATMPGIQECAVYGIPDDHWGQRVTAAVVTTQGADVDEESVREFCRGRLAGYQVPRTVVVLPELPRTATGKVVRTRLVEDTVASLGTKR